MKQTKKLNEKQKMWDAWKYLAVPVFGEPLVRTPEHDTYREALFSQCRSMGIDVDEETYAEEWVTFFSASAAASDLRIKYAVPDIEKLNFPVVVFSASVKGWHEK